MSIQVTVDQHGPIRRIRLEHSHSAAHVPAVASVFQVGGTLIDSGFAHVADHLVQTLLEHPPQRVLLTHHHEDHIGGLQAIRNAFGDIPVFVPANLLPFARDLGKLTKVREVFWGSPGVVENLVAFEAGEIFVDQGFEIETIETPGHCPWHCSFVVRENNIAYAISGDLVYRHKPLAIWHESSAEDAVASCDKLLNLSRHVYMLPTHLEPESDARQLLTHQSDWIKREADKVLQASEEIQSQDAVQVTLHLYGSFDSFELLSQGEISKASFVRSVLQPIKSLPADRLILPQPT